MLRGSYYLLEMTVNASRKATLKVELLNSHTSSLFLSLINGPLFFSFFFPVLDQRLSLHTHFSFLPPDHI